MAVVSKPSTLRGRTMDCFVTPYRKEMMNGVSIDQKCTSHHSPGFQQECVDTMGVCFLGCCAI